MLRHPVWLVACMVLWVAACAEPAPGISGAEATPPPAALADDLAQEPPVEVPSGLPPARLVVTDLVEGEGTPAEPDATVRVHYVGVVWGSGEVIGSTWARRHPAVLPLGRSVPGFSQGVAGTEGIGPMREGGRRRVVIPPDLGYADDPPEGVPPGATLVYVVDLLEVR